MSMGATSYCPTDALETPSHDKRDRQVDDRGSATPEECSAKVEVYNEMCKTASAKSHFAPCTSTTCDTVQKPELTFAAKMAHATPKR